jgi:hypothetical protein
MWRSWIKAHMVTTVAATSLGGSPARLATGANHQKPKSVRFWRSSGGSTTGKSRICRPFDTAVLTRPDVRSTAWHVVLDHRPDVGANSAIALAAGPDLSIAGHRQ